MDADDVQTPAVALKQLRKQAEEDGADLLILQRGKDGVVSICRAGQEAQQRFQGKRDTAGWIRCRASPSQHPPRCARRKGELPQPQGLLKHPNVRCLPPAPVHGPATETAPLASRPWLGAAAAPSWRCCPLPLNLSNTEMETGPTLRPSAPRPRQGVSASQEGSPCLPAPLTCILREEAEIVEGGNARSATSSSGSRTCTDKAQSTLSPGPGGFSAFTAGKAKRHSPETQQHPRKRSEGFGNKAGGLEPAGIRNRSAVLGKPFLVKPSWPGAPRSGG